MNNPVNNTIKPLRKSYFVLFAIVFAALMLVILSGWRAVSGIKADQGEEFDWRSEWAVEEGFSLQKDSIGYRLPTAIAFVPNPGTGPKDPLYFVTELHGSVKVVTNDRSVYTFAEDFFQRTASKELPEIEGETGLAGICLAPEQGYVFVTFAYMDDDQVLRNNIVRFESQPETFSIKASGQRAFTDIFQDYETAISHQIGSCQVANNFLFVGVGDGRQAEQSQEKNSLLGKVLRMGLDGSPASDNPFYKAGDSEKAADYVWAYGLRNPFGLSVVDNRVFIADNGSDIDRFVEIQPGENYLWDGTDWSIGARAGVVLHPDIGPVQVGYYPGGQKDLPAQYGSSFFIASSRPEMAGVIRIGYSLADQRLSSIPAFFVRHLGESHQLVSGVAMGPDGLYFAPVMPGGDGETAIFKIAYNPDQENPYLLTQLKDPESLMWEKGCFGCHQLDSEGGNAGPALDQKPLVERLEARLGSQEYLESIASVESLNREPFHSYQKARVEVAQAKDDQKLRLWMIYHIMEPRFDNQYSQMPNLGLTKAEATIITDYLLEQPSLTERAKELIMPFMPPVIMPRHLFFSFAGGTLMGAALLVLGRLVRKAVENRKLTRGSARNR